MGRCFVKRIVLPAEHCASAGPHLRRPRLVCCTKVPSAEEPQLLVPSRPMTHGLLVYPPILTYSKWIYHGGREQALAFDHAASLRANCIDS